MGDSVRWWRYNNVWNWGKEAIYSTLYFFWSLLCCVLVYFSGDKVISTGRSLKEWCGYASENDPIAGIPTCSTNLSSRSVRYRIRLLRGEERGETNGTY